MQSKICNIHQHFHLLNHHLTRLELRVQHFDDDRRVVALPILPGPLGQGERALERLHPGDELQEQDSKAVDVALGRDYPGVEIDGVDVAQGALDCDRGVGSLGMAAKLAEPQVCKLGVVVADEEDVGGFDVAVDDGGISHGVEVVEGVGDVQGDAEAVPPCQRAGEVAVAGVHPVEEALVGDVFEEEELLSWFFFFFLELRVIDG